MRSEAFLGYLLAGLALVLFTSGILVTKVAASRINLNLGFLIAATTNVVFAALAFFIQLGMRHEGLQWNARALLMFSLAGGFATYLGRWFFYEAVVRFGPSRASVFQVSSPLFTALIAWWSLGEGLTAGVLAGMAVTIGGLMLVSYKPGAAIATGHSGPPAGPLANAASPAQRLLHSMLVLGLGSSLAYAVGNVLRGTAIRLWNEPVLGALAGAAAGLALSVVFTFKKRELLADLRRADRKGVWLYVYLGVATITAQMCAIAAMRYIPLSIATLVALCTPVLVFPLSRVLFKNSDDVTRITLLGCVLALVGIFIIVLR